MTRDLCRFVLGSALVFPSASLIGCGPSAPSTPPGSTAADQDRLQQEAIKKFGEPTVGGDPANKIAPLPKK